MKTIELCKVCGTQYFKLHSRHYYCSIECKRKANPQAKPVSVFCTNCNKEATFTKANYDRKSKAKSTIGFFCSKKCEAEFRIRIAKDIRRCEFCGKPFPCRKGDKLRFCSTNCQKEWQKTTHVGNLHPSYNHNVPNERRIKKCPVCGKEMFLEPKEFETRVTCSKKCLKKTETKPHLAITRLLTEMELDFSNEYRVGNYFVDIRLEKSNLLVEVNGDWWHVRPDKKPYRKDWNLVVLKEKARRDFICSKGYIILYLWEKEITESIELCRKLISLYVSRNGLLKDYNSFNYILSEKQLTLKDEKLESLYKEFLS